MALFFFHDNRADIGNQILVGRSLAKQGPQVMIVLAEQAGAELAIGSQPDAGAMAAEGLGDGSDEADFTGCAVGKTVLASGLAALVRNLHERPAGVDSLVDFRGGDDDVARPVAVGIERIEADVDAAEAGGKEPVAPFGQQVAVGGHGELNDAEGVETRDVVLDAFADERFAAGDADFAYSKAKENPGDTVELGPGEDFIVVAIVFRVGGAAVDAAEIAAVRDGDAQVGDLPAEFVVKGHGLPQYFDAAPRVSGARSLENKTARSMAWNRAQTKKHIFSSVAPFQAGGLGVSTQTLSPESSRDVAPVAVGCLSR